MDFIEKVASVSSTSGKPYVIRFKDSHEVKCGDYLKEELKKLEKDKPEKSQDAANKWLKPAPGASMVLLRGSLLLARRD
jgi:hypothetical protein